jgi:predicted dienelactone hydrolase
LPEGEASAPLVVFAHGFYGHPRKFTRLFARWARAGYAVAAPAFPLTSDTAPKLDYADVAEQPADVSFVLDRVLEEYGDRLDAGSVALAGFSLGAATVLAGAFERSVRDGRARAAIAISGPLRDGGRDYDFGGIPLLVVHGDGDASVPYERAREIWRLARPPKALLTIDGPYHQHLVEDEPAVPEAAAVVDEATTAFLDLALRGDAEAAACLRQIVEASSIASLEADGVWGSG